MVFLTDFLPYVMRCRNAYQWLFSQ